MRCLVQVQIPVEVGNAGLLDGSLLPKIQRYLSDVKPEAVYFSPASGQRTIYIFLNIESSDKLVDIAEPLWLDLQADVDVIPVMNADDFQKAAAGIQRVVQARK